MWWLSRSRRCCLGFGAGLFWARAVTSCEEREGIGVAWGGGGLAFIEGRKEPACNKY